MAPCVHKPRRHGGSRDSADIVGCTCNAVAHVLIVLVQRACDFDTALREGEQNCSHRHSNIGFAAPDVSLDKHAATPKDMRPTSHHALCAPMRAHAEAAARESMRLCNAHCAPGGAAI